jgi:cytochrome c553
MRTRTAILPAAAVLAIAAWAPPQAARAGGPPPVRPPARLSETGLYAGPGTLIVDPRNRPYAPQYPLWTDGAAKARWIYLPEGAAIDASDADAWSFPVGTKLWKEFSFAGRKVETRLLWKASADGWVFAAYVWDEAQTDAVLAPEEGIPGHVEIAPGRRHSIPSLADCSACHEAGRSPVLGFGALQLSDDRDPLAPHAEELRPGMVTLRTLVEEGRLDPPRDDLVRDPPRIRAGSPRERAALGYLAANCGICHNTAGPLARVGLVLAHEVTGQRGTLAAALASAVDAPGRFTVPGAPPGASRLLAPGDPARSAVVYRMRSRRPSSQMPPLGTVLPDEEAIRLVTAWIAEDLPITQPAVAQARAESP